MPVIAVFPEERFLTPIVEQDFIERKKTNQNKPQKQTGRRLQGFAVVVPSARFAGKNEGTFQLHSGTAALPQHWAGCYDLLVNMVLTLVQLPAFIGLLPKELER